MTLMRDGTRPDDHDPIIDERVVVVGQGSQAGIVPAEQKPTMEGYERRLRAAVERLGCQLVDWDYSRRAAWVEIRLGNTIYRISHSAQVFRYGHAPRNGADAFIQIVLTMEDLVRAVARGVLTTTELLSGVPHRVHDPDFDDPLPVAGEGTE